MAVMEINDLTLDRIFYFLSNSDDGGASVQEGSLVDRRWHRASLRYLAHVFYAHSSRQLLNQQLMRDCMGPMRRAVGVLVIGMTFLHPRHVHPKVAAMAAPPATVARSTLPFGSISSATSTLSEGMTALFRRLSRGRMPSQQDLRAASSGGAPSRASSLPSTASQQDLFFFTSGADDNTSTSFSSVSGDGDSSDTDACVDWLAPGEPTELTDACYCRECMQLFDLADLMVQWMDEHASGIHTLVLDFCHQSVHQKHDQAILSYFFSQLVRQSIILHIDTFAMQHLPHMDNVSLSETSHHPPLASCWLWLQMCVSAPRHLFFSHCTSALFQHEFDQLMQVWDQAPLASIHFRGIVLPLGADKTRHLTPHFRLPRNLKTLALTLCDPAWVLPTSNQSHTLLWHTMGRSHQLTRFELMQGAQNDEKGHFAEEIDGKCVLHPVRYAPTCQQHWHADRAFCRWMATHAAAQPTIPGALQACFSNFLAQCPNLVNWSIQGWDCHLDTSSQDSGDHEKAPDNFNIQVVGDFDDENDWYADFSHDDGASPSNIMIHQRHKAIWQSQVSDLATRLPYQHL
ncbi:hypothetical protein BC940DRAFT_301265 [Gongronella butleri]|nr:hypothetical protein BC940DRAFT_301265 [Gongronella butleri]